jgi:hypothetical protein
MKKQLCIITFFLLALAMTAYAATIEPTNIILKSPKDGDIVESYTLDFIFSFDQYGEILNCSLIMDGEVNKVRNTMFEINDNKITGELTSGAHEWLIKCYTGSNAELVSETRSLKVNLPAPASGFTNTTNSEGIRTFTITPAQGQSPIRLPAMKSGDQIDIRVGAKKYELAIMRMGSAVNTSFVEVKDRTAGAIHKMLIGDSVNFDFNKDNVTEIGLALDKVERNINAYFIVTPYPGASEELPAEEIVEENTPSEPPADVVTEDNITQDTQQPPSNGTPQETPQAEPALQEEPSAEAEEEQAGDQSHLLTIALAIAVLVVIIIIIAVIILRKRDEKKMAGKKSPASTTPPPVKKDDDAEGKDEGAEEPEEAEETEPEDKIPVSKEKFDIIKSQGKVNKR